MTSQPLTIQSTASKPAFLSRVLVADDRLTPIALRATLALVMFPHGAQKMLGWFGGYGFEGTMGFLTQSIGLPWLVAFAVILLEFLGPLLLVAGLGVRAVGLGLAGLMVGAIFSVHGEHGFFMNWSGSQPGEGFEYHLLVIGIGIALAMSGGGRWSLDRRLQTPKA